MKIIMIITLLIFSSQLGTIASTCQGGTVAKGECRQDCLMNKCWCNNSQANNETYDSCNQTCKPPSCIGGNMICKATGNCQQICFPGECKMSCDAQQNCAQNADENGSEKMRCSSKKCVQSCKEGNCKLMHCEGKYCQQSCGRGDCTMNCTQSVKFCSQTCTANDDCILECRAEKCQQQCSGPKKCIILNSAVCGVYVHFLAFIPVVLAGSALQHGLFQ